MRRECPLINKTYPSDPCWWTQCKLTRLFYLFLLSTHDRYLRFKMIEHLTETNLTLFYLQGLGIAQKNRSVLRVIKWKSFEYLLTHIWFLDELYNNKQLVSPHWGQKFWFLSSVVFFLIFKHSALLPIDGAQTCHLRCRRKF